MNLHGKKVAVLGLRASGIAAVKLLRLMGAQVLSYDDNRLLSVGGSENLALSDSLDWVSSIDLIVVSPAIPANHQVIKKAKTLGIPLTSELCFGASQLKCPIIAVTGTNGKTTTVGMVGKLLAEAGKKVRVVGNIGYPVSQLVLDNEELDYAVLEVSSFQLEYGKINPHIAVILNFSPDHMDRYPEYSEYIAAKTKLVRNQSADGICFLNRDDPSVWSLESDCAAAVYPFSLKKEEGLCYISDNNFVYGGAVLCTVKEFRVRGEHNKSNALCALSIASHLGVPATAALNFIRKYKLPPHRIEYVATVGDKVYYNDSKGTNVLATSAAVEMLDDSIGLIMGGSDKAEDYCDFFDSLPDKVLRVAATGSNAEKLLGSALKVGFSAVEIFPGLKDAVTALSQDANVKNVLFSPASASFDRYRNYEERGNVFKELVFNIET